MITAENISYQEIIKDISFEIPDHGVVGLVGPNGSGKTTLLRTLFGALQPTEGRVLLNGTPLATMRARTIAHELSVVAQDSGEPPGYSLPVGGLQTDQGIPRQCHGCVTRPEHGVGVLRLNPIVGRRPAGGGGAAWRRTRPGNPRAHL